jgi:hypothetical protein
MKLGCECRAFQPLRPTMAREQTTKMKTASLFPAGNRTPTTEGGLTRMMTLERAARTSGLSAASHRG